MMLITQSKTPLTSGESGTLYTGNGTYADMQKALRRQKEAAKKNGHAVKHIAAYSERRSAWWMFVCTVPTQERRFTADDLASNLTKAFFSAFAPNTCEGETNNESETDVAAIDIKKAIQEQLQLLIDCNYERDLNHLERKIETLIKAYSALGSDRYEATRQ